MTKTAQRCLAFLAGINDERPTRARIARALKRSERTVKRAIAELVENQWITCAAGGHGTAGKITVIKWINQEMAPDSKVALDSPKMAPDSARIKSVGTKYIEQATKRSQLFHMLWKATRFEIGGKMADEATVQRLEEALGTEENAWRLAARLREWNFENLPRSWGIVVVLAREVGRRKPIARAESYQGSIGEAERIESYQDTAGAS